MTVFTWILVMTLFNGIYNSHQNGSICHSSHEVQLSQQIWVKFHPMDQNQNSTKDPHEPLSALRWYNHTGLQHEGNPYYCD